MNTKEDYGLVVGINDYKNDPYPELFGAKRDAEDFLKWLKAPDGGNVQDKNVDPFTRLSTKDGREPTLSDLLILLMDLRERAPKRKTRIGRRLYLFFSGHGVSANDRLDDADLVTVEARRSLNIRLPGRQSADGLSLTASFDEVLLFMDCCRVTHLLLGPFAIPINEKGDPAAAAKVKRFYAFATGFGNTAREMPDKNGVVRGIFTRTLLDGLTKAPADENGRRTTTQLKTYLETEMAKITIDGEPLVPKFPALDEIVLTESLVSKRTLVRLTFSQPTVGIEVLDGGNNFAPVEPGDPTPVPGGMHFTLQLGKGFVIRTTDRARTLIITTEQEEIDATL